MSKRLLEIAGVASEMLVDIQELSRTSLRGVAMARMTRELTLTLVGSGILTAGYFAYPDEEKELEAKQNEQVQQQLAGNNPNHNGHRVYHPGFIWIHTGAWGSSGMSRAPAMGGHISRGGFGGIGRGSAGG
jgi:hypothetical protein